MSWSNGESQQHISGAEEGWSAERVDAFVTETGTTLVTVSEARTAAENLGIPFERGEELRTRLAADGVITTA